MTINRESKVYRQIVRALEYVFLTLADMYIIYRLLKSTTFHLVLPGWYEPCLLRGLILVAFLRFLTARPKRKETLIAVALAVIYYLVYRTVGYDFLLYMAALTVGFIDIEHRRILKMFLLTAGIIYCVTIFAGSLGLITNYVRIKSGLRSAWGMSYPTDFASMGLYLLFALWAAETRLPDWAMLLICAAFGTVTWYIAHSITSTVCVVLLFLAVLYYQFEKTIDSRHPKLKWMKSGVNLFSTIAFPLLALCFFALIAMYAKGMNVGYRFNKLLSNRLQYQLASWRTYGLKPFGTPFALHGNGFSVFPQPNYTFVDSSYLLILLRYGWVLFVAICLFWGWMARKAIRCGNRRVLLVMGIIAIHSFSEHHFIDCFYNILVVMPLAAFLPAKDAVRTQRRTDEHGRPVARRWPAMAANVLTLLILLAVAWLSGPAVLSWIKTTLEYLHLAHGEHSLRLICVLLALLCGALAVAWSVNCLLRAALERLPLRACAPAFAVLVLCACAGLAARAYAGRVIDEAARENAAALSADRKALEIAVGTTSGKVYSGIMPAVYKRGVEGVEYAAFFEDDLARLRGNTVLMPADAEHGVFFSSGYLYVPISGEHALYTGDRAVVEALTEAGYQPKGYYNGVRSVSLETAAERNELAYDTATGLRLEGLTGTMQNGPWQDLYGGKYTATWDLHLPDGANREVGVVCTLQISADKGETVLLKKKVRAEQFDDNGVRQVSIPFTIPDSRSVAFEAYTEDGRQVDIRSISFKRTPVFDVHLFYDDDLRQVRKEYYSPDGTKTVVSGGYFACEYGYDGWNNINLIRYFDRDDQPTLTSYGYTQIRRIFNARGQAVRLEYYDTDVAPIALTTGQAAEEREFDAAGNIAVERYYDVHGEPTLIKAGYAQIRRAYDKKKQVIKEAYYGIDGLPVALSDGAYAIEQEFDPDGNVSVRRFYDDQGNLMMTRNGYAQVHWRYDGQRQIIHEAFYGIDGKPVAIRSKQAANDREYDDAGNVIVYRYYDTQGAPVLTTSGYAEVHRVYDERHKVIREEYYGVDGKPISLSAGQYAIENEYDGFGNVSARRYYNDEGDLAMLRDGYAEVRWQYDDQRRVIREAFFGTDGMPILNKTGQAANEREYDAMGNIVERRYYDTQGDPVVTTMGYAAIRCAYNDKRQIIREAYFGTDGAPLEQPGGHSALEMEYDAMGNVTAERYYDGNNNPVVVAGGYAQIRRVYNRKRQITEEYYFDGRGEPCPRPAGYAGIQQEYDANGDIAVRRYTDGQGNLVTRSDGYAQARWTLDGASGTRCVSFYDAQGNEVSADGINLVLDGPCGWSEWFTPDRNRRSVNIVFASMNTVLAEAGERYTCQLEIEFEGVRATQGKPFVFQTRSTVKGAKIKKKLWDSELVNLESAPQDDVYRFALTQVTDAQTAAVSNLILGFRCDYWAAGRFRVRYVKIERGDSPSAWTMGI